MDSHTTSLHPLSTFAVGVFWAFAAGCGPLDGVTADASRHSDAARGEAQCGPCPLWTVRCGDRCVDPTVSPNHCGVCGVQCDTSRETCRGGVCVSAGRCAAVDAGVLAPEAPAASSDAGGWSRDGAASRDAARDGGSVADASGGSADAASADAGAPREPGPLGGLRGEYFGRPDFTDLRAVRLDRAVAIDDAMEMPTATFPRENFSVRWTGELRVRRSGRYEFETRADDGVRVWIDGERVVDEFEGMTPVTGRFTRMLEAGRAYDVRVEYRQFMGGAMLRLEWSVDGGERGPIPATALTARRGEAWGCSGGECCPVGRHPLCCPTGTRCVLDPTFRCCCPEGETCVAVAACPAHPG